ncbi:DUF4783 domain-containing protein [Ancylomarina longa]|uniref:DUF4783 domain-containing protein n=1 Tax=Ancylomarina longa TaxID=2487017 RepID=A0A434AG91_9BACT|nr:DUF4783 domain-containing protein [Ancylomarina longa]RUT73392.1 DUF4783 domain-containing protein [Ancylomarina longa]
MRILKYIFISLIFTLSTQTTAFSQNENDLPRGLIISFKQGNSIGLSEYFGDRVELSIQDKEAIYSKSQAKQIMAKFFREYTPSDFRKKHIGGKPGARYVIGDLITNRGNFRINFLLKEQNGKFVVHQLHIEKD